MSVEEARKKAAMMVPVRAYMQKKSGDRIAAACAKLKKETENASICVLLFNLTKIGEAVSFPSSRAVSYQSRARIRSCAVQIVARVS